MEIQARSTADRVYEFIRSRDGCTSQEIGEAIGISANHAHAIARNFERRGKVESSTHLINGRNRNVFRHMTEAASRKTVLKRAKQIGAPFGILVAQLGA